MDAGIKKRWVIILILISFFFILSMISYPMMPEKVASHWNAAGEADGYMPRSWGVFLMPSIMAGLALLLYALPKIDPLKDNIRKFRDQYGNFVIILFSFMLVVHAQMMLWNMGVEIRFNATLPLGIGALFYYAGVLCSKAKMNWSIGIRTPWTLSDEGVWDRTNRLGGKMFRVSGIISMLGVFFQRYAILFIIAPVIFTAIFTTAYSYIEYRKLHIKRK